MSIAVACTEDGQLSRHFGRTTHFQIFDLRDGEVLAVTTLNASTATVSMSRGREDHAHSHDHGHGHHHNHAGVLGTLEGCSAVLCGGMGEGVAGSLRRAGIAPVVVAGEYTPEEAALAYVRGDLRTGDIHACCGHHGHTG